MNLGITNDYSVYFNKHIEGLDYSAIKETAREIFKNATQNTQTQNTNLTKFTGMNFYNGTVSAETAKNISLQNVGQNIQLNNKILENIQYLNAQAAKIANTPAVQKTDGKIDISYINSLLNTHSNEAKPQNSTVLSDINTLSKNKQGGGNPFAQNSNTQKK